MINDQEIVKSFCTTREAAALLAVSVRTAQLWVESGMLEAWKTSGGHRRITRQSIERLLADSPFRPAQGRRADDQLPVAATAPFNVLVVEDDAALRRLYEIKLRDWPMKPTIHTASDGYEALIRMGYVKPDLLIADLHMPGTDGFRMLRTISSAPELEGIAVVVVSGLDAEEISARGGVPDGVSVLPKPVPFDQLRSIAERLVAQRQIPGLAR